MKLYRATLQKGNEHYIYLWVYAENEKQAEMMIIANCYDYQYYIQRGFHLSVLEEVKKPVCVTQEPNSVVIQIR